MNQPAKNPNRPRRPAKNTFTTKSGNTIKLQHSITDRIRARRDAKARRRAAYMSRLPKNRWKRLAYRMKPKELAAYWFSRDGGIMALKIVGIGIIVCFVVLVGLFSYFRKDLPKINDISGDKLGGTTTYYDRTGQTVLFQDYTSVKRIPVQYKSISPYMVNATVAIEDKGFWTEGAFNVRGILRAAYHDVFGGSNGLQGGSTITQQLVKLTENWTNNHTITRKLKEIILAVELGREYSKTDILNGYLNVAPYGGQEYGVEAAARDYFGVTANQLSLPQAALLAAIPQYPSGYSPYSSPRFNPAASGADFDENGLLARKNYILDQMVKQHYITQAQADAAKQVDVLSQVKPMSSKYNNIIAPDFVLQVRQQLEQKYGAETVNLGGWQVTTTLDMNLQKDAETDIANNLKNVKSYGGEEEAMVGESVPTGQVVALVGNVDFSNSQYGQVNYANTPLPPGSSFKPYDYSTFIDNSTNVGAGSAIYDVAPQNSGPQPALTLKDVNGPTKGGYPCTNKTPVKFDPNGNCLWDYDFADPGPMPIRYALAGSRNVPAVKAMMSMGDDVASVNKVISTADAMMDVPNAYQCYSNIAKTKTTQCYLSSAIGDGAYTTITNHVNGLATLGRLGLAIPQSMILKINDGAGKTIYQWTQPKGTQVIRPDTAYIIDNILSDPKASYLRGHFKVQNWNGWDFAIKTGTTMNNYDGLMTSWSTQLAVVSWVGTYNHGHSMTPGSMETMTAPLTENWMEQATSNLHMAPKNWQAPSDIKTGPAYVVSGWSINSGAVLPSPSNDIYPSWYVTPSKSTSSQTIDIVSGGVATSCTPAAAKKTADTGNLSALSADLFYNNSGSTATASGTDTVHQCGDTPPTITVTENQCDATGKCDFLVAITQGTHALSGGTYNTPPAGTVSLIVNGQNVQTISIPSDASSPYTATFSGITGITSGESVQAQVYDSVLYGGSNTINATVPSP